MADALRLYPNPGHCGDDHRDGQPFADWRHAAARRSAPKNDRLAVVYITSGPPDAWRTLIEIWDAGDSMNRIAAFPIRGSVGCRIGWSQDARRLAAIRTTGDRTDALIYAIP